MIMCSCAAFIGRARRCSDSVRDSSSSVLNSVAVALVGVGKEVQYKSHNF